VIVLQNQMKRGRSRRFWLTATLLALLLILGDRAAFNLLSNHSSSGQAAGQIPPAKQTAITTERVLILGGSVARGWKDTGWENWRKGWFGGYLVRAFTTLSKQTHVHYKVENGTIVGANSVQLGTMYKGHYSAWLKRYKPSLVVISWGGLNDALPKTPIALYRASIHHEVALALAAHAQVWIVTPPATPASYTQFPTLQPYYLQAEISEALTFHNKNVFVFDVFNQMKRYLSVHHRSVNLYAANAWHPNELGHVLAGQLLANDAKRQFGQ